MSKFFCHHDLAVEIADKVLYVLSENDLDCMRATPLLLQMVCIVWDACEHKLPLSNTELYLQFHNVLCAQRDARETPKDMLHKLGKLSYEGLTSKTAQNLAFKRAVVVKSLGEDLVILSVVLGIMVEEAHIVHVSQVKLLMFYHKSIQEFYAGIFIAHSVNCDSNSAIFTAFLAELPSLVNILKLWKVIQFFCGDVVDFTAIEKLFDRVFGIVCKEACRCNGFDYMDQIFPDEYATNPYKLKGYDSELNQLADVEAFWIKEAERNFGKTSFANVYFVHLAYVERRWTAIAFAMWHYKEISCTKVFASETETCFVTPSIGEAGKGFSFTIASDSNNKIKKPDLTLVESNRVDINDAWMPFAETANELTLLKWGSAELVSLPAVVPLFHNLEKLLLINCILDVDKLFAAFSETPPPLLRYLWLAF